MSRLLTGVVTRDKSDKTIVVSVASRKTHPLYKKRYSSSAKFMAHDEKNEAKTGDLVVIRESRPLSARKRFVLEQIVEKAEVGFQEADALAGVPEPEVKTKPTTAEMPKSAEKTVVKDKVKIEAKPKAPEKKAAK